MNEAAPRPALSTRVGFSVLILLVVGILTATGIFLLMHPNAQTLPVLASMAAVAALIQFGQVTWRSVLHRESSSLLEGLAWGMVLVAAAGTAIYGFAYPTD